MDAALAKVSKRLAYVLRHDPASVGITLDANGWVDVDVLLGALSVTRAVFDRVVATNDKRRYAVRVGPDGREQVRAQQGHSVSVDLDLAELAPPPVLFHGTPATALAAIQAEGLWPGERHHVHLSPDIGTARTVGQRRRGPTVVLRIDAAGMAAAGHLFHRSGNGVWLTAHVPPAFLSVLPASP